MHLLALSPAAFAQGAPGEHDGAAVTAMPEGIQPYYAVGIMMNPNREPLSATAETFAEFFACWKVDPAAMRRAYPDVVDWFEAGEHLSGCRVDVDTRPSPELLTEVGAG